MGKVNYAHRTIWNTLIVIALNLCGAVLGYLIRLLFARNLTPAEFGLFYAVYALIGLFSLFRTLGLNEATGKYIAEWNAHGQFGKIKNLISTVVSFQFSSALLLGAALYFLKDWLAAGYFKDPVAAPLLAFVLLSFLITCFGDIFKFIFQGFQRMFLSSSVNVLKMLLVVTLSFAFFRAGAGILAPAYAYVLTYLILPVVYFPFLLRIFPFFRISATPDPELRWRLLRFGIPVMLGLAGYMLIEYIDVLILTYFRTLDEVGLYNAALPTSKLLFYFSGSLGFVILPLVSEMLAKGKRNELLRGLEIIYQYTAIIMVPIGLVMFSFPEIALRVLFGDAYVAASTALQVLTIASILFTLFSLNASLFLGMGRPKAVTYIVLIGAGVNIAMNLLLIPRYGMLGAAIAMVGAYGTLLLLSMREVRRSLAFSLPWHTFAKIIGSGLLFLGIIALLKQVLVLSIWMELVLSVGIASIAYIGALFLFRTIRFSEIAMLLGHLKIRATRSAR